MTLFAPFYQTNDDVAMRLLAEGHFLPGDTPRPFLMFINVAVGELLSFLYKLAPAVTWYDLVMGVSLTAAAAALLFVWIGSGTRNEVSWAILFALFFLLPAFVSVQFSVAGLCCAAAAVALLARRSTSAFRLLPSAFFIWGSLIRVEGAVLMAIEGTLLALPFALRDDLRPRLRAALLAACIAAVLFAVNWRVDPGFYEYHRLRAGLAESLPPERITPAALARLQTEVGWSANDFALFRDWFFADPALYSLDKVRKAEAIFGHPANWRIGLDVVKRFPLEMRWAFVFMAAFALARGGRRLLLYWLFATLTIVMLAGAIAIALRAPPQHIAWPMLILGATMLAIAARRWEEPRRHGWIIVAAVLVLTARSVAALHSTSEVHRRASETVRRDVAELRRSGARLFVLHGSAFPFEEYWRPLHDQPEQFGFVPLGVSARTPPVQDFLRRNGMTDLPWALCTDPALAIVAHPHIPPMLARSVLEHHRAEVRFEPVFRSERFTAWRCVQSSTANPKPVRP